MHLNSLRTIENHAQHGFIMEKNADILIPPEAGCGVLRANVYRPLDTDQGKRYPVIMTLGPYGKDLPYSAYFTKSFSDIPDNQKSEFSAWETPEPTYWPKQGYVLVRVDERGYGQSPGIANIWSAQTASDYKVAINWAASQPWSSGKVGLLGISYYAVTQWMVAARRPKGLACIIPWEGMTDLYDDLGRQGGIMGNKFIDWWHPRLIHINQYGRPGKASRGLGPDTIECSLTEDELRHNEVDIKSETFLNRYSDDEYFQGRKYELEDIEVPLLSIANLGGITIHLRGNIKGYVRAGSKNKWLYFISGRHDVPAYWPEYVALQKSFLDAWLKGVDDRGWLKGPNAPGGVPAVNLLLRAGNPGINSIDAERSFSRRTETEWPIARTQYKKFYLNPDFTLTPSRSLKAGKFTYQGHCGDALTFKTAPFEETTEVTGHITANVVVSIEADSTGRVPKDLDLFATIRHFDADDNEIFYTGNIGDPVPPCKGWLRASLRAIDPSHPWHRSYQPYRSYSRNTVSYPKPGVPFGALIELWPTNVIVARGSKLVFEISPKDTQGVGVGGSDHPEDRHPEIFAGHNVLHVGGNHDSWVEFPIIPEKDVPTHQRGFGVPPPNGI